MIFEEESPYLALYLNNISKLICRCKKCKILNKNKLKNKHLLILLFFSYDKLFKIIDLEMKRFGDKSYKFSAHSTNSIQGNPEQSFVLKISHS